MKIKILSILFLVLTIGELQAASGIYDSYSILKIGNRTEFFDLGAATGLTDFNGATMYTNTQTPVYLGGQAKSYKNNGTDVTAHKISYRIYESGSPSGSYTAINYSFQWNQGDGGAPANLNSSGDQQWGTDVQGSNATNGITQIMAAGALAAGTYTIEVYHEITTNGTDAASNIYNNNSNNNYKMTLVIMDPPGNSLHFDGTNNYVNCNNSASFQLSSGTVECWFKATSTVSGYAGIVIKQSAYGIFLNNGILGFFDWSTGSFTSSGISVSNNTWHHVAFTFSSGTSNGSHLFLDGELIASNTYTVSNQTMNLAIGAGRSPSPIQFFAGEIDEVRIWNTMRTPDELISNMYTTLVGNETGLVGYYNFDQGSPAGTNTGISTLYDLSGTGNNGTLTSMALTGATSNWVASEARIVTETTALTYMGAGNSLTFDGTNEKITIGNILTAEYTKEAWINYDGSATTNNNLISGSSTYQHSFQVASSYSFHLSAGHNNTWDYVKDPNQLSPNVWHHVAVSYSSAGVMKLYADGILVDEASSVPAISGSIPSLVQIGAFGVNAYFTGQIDEVRIWSDVRTEEEIRENMFRRLAGDEANLVAYYTFDASSGTTLTDKTSNGHNGTLVNMEDADWTDATARNAAKAITADGNWNTASTWLNGSVPNAATTDVQLLSNITLDTDISVRMLHVTSGDTLTINSLKTLSTSGSVLNAGVVTIANTGALIQGSSSGLVNGGTFNVNKSATPASGALRYDFWGSPITAGDVDILGALGGNRYWYNPAAATTDLALGWTAASGTMVVGRGYIATNSGDVTFTGTVNNGDITYTAVTATNSSVNIENLISNPYPSGLDLTLFAAANVSASQLTSSFYFWDDKGTAGNYGTDGYATYNSTTSTWTAAGFSGSSPAPGRSIIASGQGFVVVPGASAPASFDITFTNSMRVANTDTFYRAGSDYQRFWVQLTKDSSHFSEMAVVAHPDAVESYDAQFDSKRLDASSSTSSINAYYDITFVVIKSLPVFSSRKQVPLTVNIAEDGIYKFAVSKSDNIDGLKIFLFDNLTGMAHLISNNNEHLQLLTVGSYFDRFYLVFDEVENAGTAIEEVHSIQYSITPRDIILTNINEPMSYEVYSLNGQLLEQANLATNSIDLSTYSTGIYLVKLKTASTTETIKFARH